VSIRNAICKAGEADLTTVFHLTYWMHALTFSLRPSCIATSSLNTANFRHSFGSSHSSVYLPEFERSLRNHIPPDSFVVMPAGIRASGSFPDPPQLTIIKAISRIGIRYIILPLLLNRCECRDRPDWGTRRSRMHSDWTFDRQKGES
jgi:hypothetical protein